MYAALQGLGRVISGFSESRPSSLSSCGDGKSWSTDDYIRAHKAVKESNNYNFEGCRIPIPTAIKYDWMEAALGNQVSSKEKKILSLIKYGMPINCKREFGVKRIQKNHYSAICHENAIIDYINKNIENQALLGPFKEAPIPDICFSPLMTVPKEEDKRRIIVDFSFPPGKAVNDGIPKEKYLDLEVEFSLPSVQSMVSRVNELGPGCLLYKKDLQGAFPQFSIDPGDYSVTVIFWQDQIYLDTRLAMGLRCSAYCCQSVTEIVAKIVNKKSHALVYFDDFGGAELADRAMDSFNYLGTVLKQCGLVEAPEKAVAPSTKMNWLGVCFDTVEWSMALKHSNFQELLNLLPKLIKYKRVKKLLLQKGNYAARQYVRLGNTTSSAFAFRGPDPVYLPHRTKTKTPWRRRR